MPAEKSPIGGGRDRIGLGITLAVLTFVVFSTNDVIVKWVSGGYSVFLIAFIVSGFALLPTVAIVAATGGLSSLKPRSPALVLTRAVLLLISTLAIYTAFRTLSMAETYTLVFTAPLLITLLSVPMLGEKVGWRRSLAVVIGFGGVLVILRPGVQTLGLGHLAAFICALTYSLSALILRRSSGETANAWLFPMIIVKATATALLVTAVDGWVVPEAGDLALMAVAGLCYGSGHFLIILAFRMAPAAVIAPFQYSQMVWAVVFGITVFGDWPDGYTLAGAAIIVGTGIYIALRENAKKAAEGNFRVTPKPDAL